MVKDIDNSNDFSSLNAIIENWEHDKKRLYKIKTEAEELGRANLDSLDSRFVSIRVKRQNYLGESAIAIYLRDSTKKIEARLNHLQKMQ